jgi:hypothetical protein
MNGRRIVFWSVLVIVALGFGYGAYDVYARYTSFSKTIAEDRARAVEIAANRARTNQALAKIGVNELQASRGFWYTYTDQYGTQSVFYFDPAQWSLRDDLSSSTLEALESMIANSTVVDREAMHDVPENGLPPRLQFNNQLYTFSTRDGFIPTRVALEKAYASNIATSDQLWQLAYIYELEGQYGKREEVNALNCKKYKAQCARPIPVQLLGAVADLSGRPLEDARVSVLGHAEVGTVTTDAKGKFSIILSVRPMEKVRVSAVKRNFSSGVANLLITGAGRTKYALDTIILGSPISIVTVDTVHHTVTDPTDVARADGSFVLHATSSTYEIPAEAIVHTNGAPYAGLVDVYLYEFTRDTVPQNLITLDTFDQVMGYAGDLMRSYGMPYIQFFAPSGEELDVKKSTPMLLTYKVAGMKDLFENIDRNPGGKVTPDIMQTLVSASQGDPGFPITREFLVKNKLYAFPPFWVLDRQSGVWDNVGIRVLDVAGTIQAPFYTINDMH